MSRKYESDPMVGDLGACSVCGNVRTLTVKGVLRVHGDPKQRGMNCRGSARAPAEGGVAARVAPPKDAVDLVEAEGGEAP